MHVPAPRYVPHVSNDPRWFTTTHWSMVLAAGENPSPGSSAALERLCRTYWQPLYAYARRLGHRPEEAQDLVQAFFARLLEKRFLETADPQRGKFRSYLLSAFKHFVANEWRRENTVKRGGRAVITSIELELAEDAYRREPTDSLTPQDVYEKRWVLSLLENVFVQIRREYAGPEKKQLFDCIKGHLTGDAPGCTYQELADRLGMTEGAIKVAVHRLRKRFKETLMAEVADTVAAPEQVEEEIGYMLQLMSR